MPLFRYTALTDTGKKMSGVIDADSLVIAKDRLRREKVLVTHLESLAEKRRELFLPPPLRLAFTRELAQLLRAGLPLYESLVTIEEKYQKHKAHALFVDLCDRLKGGLPLSFALQNYPRTFDEVYIAMVKAAEQTGSLAYTFDQLSLLLSKNQKIHKQLTSALIYPAFLGSFCFLVLFSLLFFVVPSMAELFEGRQLHPITQFILSLSSFVTHYTAAIFVSFALFIGSLYFGLRHPKGKRLLHEAILQIPFVKTIVLQGALIRLSRCLSLLLTGGVPLAQALPLSRKVMRHPSLEEAVSQAEKTIVEGKHFSEGLKSFSLVPPMIVRMLAISEETGKMAPMLQNIAEIYEEELEKNLLQLTTLLQPILLLILGLVVGLVLLAVLLPLTDVSSIMQT